MLLLHYHSTSFTLTNSQLCGVDCLNHYHTQLLSGSQYNEDQNVSQ